MAWRIYKHEVPKEADLVLPDGSVEHLDSQVIIVFYTVEDRSHTFPKMYLNEENSGPKHFDWLDDALDACARANGREK